LSSYSTNSMDVLAVDLQWGKPLGTFAGSFRTSQASPGVEEGPI
jgi:hypothetical protein